MLLLTAVVAFVVSTLAANKAPYQRSIFYVGGEYVYNATLDGTILVQQQYVEELTPVRGVRQPYPIVLIHGGGLSGTEWLNKPDDGAGWASYFLFQGYCVYIVDVWSVGRSTGEDLPAVASGGTVELVERAFTAPELYHSYYQAQFHTQWPDNGTRGNSAFDAFYARFLPFNDEVANKLEPIAQVSTCALLARIGPSVLISDGVGSLFAFLATDKCPQDVKAHVTFNPDPGPFTSYDAGVYGTTTTTKLNKYGFSDIPLNFDPPATSPNEIATETTGSLKYTDGLLSSFPCYQQKSPVRHLVSIAKAPVLILTGEATIHATYDQCLAQFLDQAGVNVNHTNLADVGIKGNGQFLNVEKNSDEIAGLIDSWIGSKLGGPGNRTAQS